MAYAGPMTDAQRALITKLYSEAGTPEKADSFFSTHPTKNLASSKITDLINAARARRAAAPPPAWTALVFPEAGYYAVSYENALRFYRVKEAKGRYAGRKFIDRFKSDELRFIAPVERATVLAEIIADPEKAAMRFAKELTRCYCCGRMLTDEISRLRGVGPDCYGRKAEKDEIGMALLGDAR